MGAIAEFECAQISERTKAGMQAARRKGKVLGRPRRMSGDQVEQARILLSERVPVKTVATELNVSRTTLWREKIKNKCLD